MSLRNGGSKMYRFDNFALSAWLKSSIPRNQRTYILTQILTPSRLYLIDMGNEVRARDSRPPPPHPPGNLFLTGKSDESR